MFHGEQFAVVFSGASGWRNMVVLRSVWCSAASRVGRLPIADWLRPAPKFPCFQRWLWANITLLRLGLPHPPAPVMGREYVKQGNGGVITSNLGIHKGC